MAFRRVFSLAFISYYQGLEWAEAPVNLAARRLRRRSFQDKEDRRKRHGQVDKQIPTFATCIQKAGWPLSRVRPRVRRVCWSGRKIGLSSSGNQDFPAPLPPQNLGVKRRQTRVNDRGGKNDRLDVALASFSATMRNKGSVNYGLKNKLQVAARSLRENKRR